MKRKQFIHLSAFATTALMVPNFLQAAGKTGAINVNGKKLVVIQLSGGNDGLNTIVPFTNDIYYQNRPTIAIAKENVLKLNDSLGMNNVMTGFKELYDSGNMAILNNVGYPNPDRSHFRSMDIWHSASIADEYLNTGWIGRYLDATCAGCAKPTAAIEIDDTLSLALKGKDVKGMAMKDIAAFYRNTKLTEDFNNPAFASSNDNLNYLYKTLAEVHTGADYLLEKSKVYKSKATYPVNALGKDLKTIAELIISGTDTSVYYTSLSGFDTHAAQVTQQNKRLEELSSAVSTFVKDLKANNKFNDVCIMVFSEFGRRVKQNASNGTDHGTANNVFIIGNNLKKHGVLNDNPDLITLDEGDLIYKTDFRSVYATLLNNWLGANDKLILGSEFAKLNFV
jgi:uncharacterized protein (DUF1501 family)